MTYKFALDGIEFETESFDLAKQGKEVNNELIKLRAAKDSLETKLATANDSIGELKADLQESKAALNQLEVSLDAAEAKYDSLKLDMDDRDDSSDVEAQVDNSEIADIISGRMRIWQETLPLLRSDNADYEPDYSLTEIEIMAEAVKVANPQLSEQLDSIDLNDTESAGFVKGLYAGIASGQSAKRKHKRNVDSLLEDVREGRTRLDMSEDAAIGNSALMDKARSNYTQAKKRRRKKLVVVENN